MLAFHTMAPIAPQSEPLILTGAQGGIALTGPGGTVVLTSAMLAAVADFAILLQDVLEPEADYESDPQNEGEPAFGSADQALCNRYGEGAGCSISDPDFGAEEAGEPEEDV